ncbi:hypothetical protein BCR32DRAFT_290092 [Anaeromyces robustus]|uniref:Uncharacterized protein n=1 Tax=Anaeromyces robustus TaxID=1754192 RepID=A0A1Y1XKT2_9FUNG|nr:hypothetical protein BCR32DRAFT_290092 [Anaeromyces robustus]|eukprot:ORX86369.1 hypothetical protein BCR32DRAFT_290092 [Anaeromyces robustus]
MNINKQLDFITSETIMFHSAIILGLSIPFSIFTIIYIVTRYIKVCKRSKISPDLATMERRRHKEWKPFKYFPSKNILLTISCTSNICYILLSYKYTMYSIVYNDNSINIIMRLLLVILSMIGFSSLILASASRFSSAIISAENKIKYYLYLGYIIGIVYISEVLLGVFFVFKGSYYEMRNKALIFILFPLIFLAVYIYSAIFIFNKHIKTIINDIDELNKKSIVQQKSSLKEMKSVLTVHNFVTIITFLMMSLRIFIYILLRDSLLYLIIDGLIIGILSFVEAFFEFMTFIVYYYSPHEKFHLINDKAVARVELKLEPLTTDYELKEIKIDN